jgi:hypothetical protein
LTKGSNNAIIYTMDLIDFIQTNWTVITALVAMIISYTQLKMQNIDQERRIRTLEANERELNPVFLEIKTKLAGIEATLAMLVKKQ